MQVRECTSWHVGADEVEGRNISRQCEGGPGNTVEVMADEADLCVQFGGWTSDAVGAQAWLVGGGREPMERYAVTINDAAIKAEAMSMGLYTITQNADQVAAAQARAEVAQRNYNAAVAKSCPLNTTYAADDLTPGDSGCCLSFNTFNKPHN